MDSFARRCMGTLACVIMESFLRAACERLATFPGYPRRGFRQGGRTLCLSAQIVSLLLLIYCERHDDE